MSSRQKKLNELSVLMELRLAFGPGTRLWAHRSREELCYDWLQFKARQADANFRDFALRLYAYEKEHSLHRARLSEIRKRVAIVLKAHRIKKRSPMLPVGSPRPLAQADSQATQNGCCRQAPSGSEVPVTPALIQDLDQFPLRQNEVARCACRNQRGTSQEIT